MGFCKVFSTVLKKEGEIVLATSTIPTVSNDGTEGKLRYVLDGKATREIIEACLFKKYPAGDIMFKVELVDGGKLNTAPVGLVPLSEKSKQFKSIW